MKIERDALTSDQHKAILAVSDSLKKAKDELKPILSSSLSNRLPSPRWV
jgi:hypothetical protein